MGKPRATLGRLLGQGEQLVLALRVDIVDGPLGILGIQHAAPHLQLEVLDLAGHRVAEVRGNCRHSTTVSVQASGEVELEGICLSPARQPPSLAGGEGAAPAGPDDLLDELPTRALDALNLVLRQHLALHVVIWRWTHLLPLPVWVVQWVVQQHSAHLQSALADTRILGAKGPTGISVRLVRQARCNQLQCGTRDRHARAALQELEHVLVLLHLAATLVLGNPLLLVVPGHVPEQQRHLRVELRQVFVHPRGVDERGVVSHH
mmetsp:Transcript_40355/g.104439  ORF Transcript_40355/g.104439 Transcript_40355/m.104439 type:complete len:262 (-) Transcript_40355:58-843(-)